MNDLKNTSPALWGKGSKLGYRDLQVNLGLKCNQECHHCHLEASPRHEEMNGLAHHGTDTQGRREDSVPTG